MITFWISNPCTLHKSFFVNGLSQLKPTQPMHWIKTAQKQVRSTWHEVHKWKGTSQSLIPWQQQFDVIPLKSVDQCCFFQLVRVVEVHSKDYKMSYLINGNNGVSKWCCLVGTIIGYSTVAVGSIVYLPLSVTTSYSITKKNTTTGTPTV